MFEYVNRSFSKRRTDGMGKKLALFCLFHLYLFLDYNMFPVHRDEEGK